MTVHLFRCFIGRGSMSISDLETRIDDWVASNAAWTDDTVAHTLSEFDTAIDGSGQTFHGVEVRFLKENTKSNLLQKFEDKLQNKVAWYRVGYHACTHRQGDGSSGPCSFDPNEDPEAMATEWTDKDVTIPSGVPDFPDAAYQ